MKRNIKKQLKDILIMVRDLHQELPRVTDMEQKNELLQNAQNAALSIGNTIEQFHKNAKPIVAILQKYCDNIFKLSSSSQITEKDAIGLNYAIKKVEIKINAINTEYQVLFTPYKAAMWDSLESIWKSFKSDENCEVYIMPIPYYEFNATTNKWEYHYDGPLFPEDVPIINFKTYSLEKNQPDIIFTHNPFDTYNHIVALPPEYVSKRLKEFTDCLVYVPYFVTSGFFPNKRMPVYDNMDIMIIQSEHAKNQFKDTPYYNKIVPLGSPKLDKIINMCKNSINTPDEWKPIIKGKKTIMLNTSIQTFLSEEENYFNKIRYICNSLTKRENIALIWRPHPLLESTIRSMRPELQEKFQELKKWFIKNEFGILDTTTGISKTVALCDAYIGEEASSIINLFAASAKPIFILNNMITKPYSDEEQRKICIFDIAKCKNQYFITTVGMCGLFSIDIEDGTIKHLGFSTNQNKWNTANSTLLPIDDTIYMTPYQTEHSIQYSIMENSFQTNSETLACNNFFHFWSIHYDNKIFYIPLQGDGIKEYNIKSNKWNIHTDCIDALIGNCQDRVADTTGAAYFKNSLWIVAEYTNRVLEFDMNNGTYYCIHYIGETNNGYSAITVTDENIWLSEVHTGNIICWNKYSKETTIIQPPKGFNNWYGAHERAFTHIRLIDMGEYLFTIPGFANTMFKLNKKTKKTTIVMNSFWNSSDDTFKNFDKKRLFMTACTKKLDETHIFIQRSSDLTTAIYNIDTDSYKIINTELSKDSFDQILNDEDGFEKALEDRCFYKRESRLFSFDGFLDDLVSGKLDGLKERQMKEMQTMAVNMDGTCGQKVHDYLMEYIENK